MRKRTRQRQRARELQRNLEITVARFNRLPFLIPRGVVEEWTGLTSEDISLLVKSGRLRVWRTHGKAKAKFYRSEVEAILGFDGRTPPGTTGVGLRPAT